MNDKPTCDYKMLSGAKCSEIAIMRIRTDAQDWDNRCPDHAWPLRRSFFVIEEIPSRPEERFVSAADIEQVVADAENKLDDLGGLDVAYDLIQRLRILAGLDVSGYPAPPMMDMTIGRRDQCLISVPHSHEFCGKPEAHCD